MTSVIQRMLSAMWLWPKPSKECWDAMRCVYGRGHPKNAPENTISRKSYDDAISAALTYSTVYCSESTSRYYCLYSAWTTLTLCEEDLYLISCNLYLNMDQNEQEKFFISYTSIYGSLNMWKPARNYATKWFGLAHPLYYH